MADYHRYHDFESWLFHYEGRNRGKSLKKKTSDGHILIFKPNHHAVRYDGYVMEHRVIWEQSHNACLLPWANVFHINGIKTDNRPENLKAMMWHREYIPRRLAKDIPKILKKMGL